MRILAGIVTYNPDIIVLTSNIEAILPQVEKVIIVDNHSDNVREILRLIGDDERFFIIENNDNLGIAKALNQECEYGITNHFDWILTLDQDSIVPPDMIVNYKKYVSVSMAAMISCIVLDRNIIKDDSILSLNTGFKLISTTITSGSLLKLSAWDEVGGFCEKMFIDSVDHDMCYSLLEHGYLILQTEDVGLSHEVGHSQVKSIFGKKVQIYNESPLRCYYIFRNRILLAKRHWKTIKKVEHKGVIGFANTILLRIYAINRYEKNRFQKDRMILRGLWHGIIGRYGKY